MSTKALNGSLKLIITQSIKPAVGVIETYFIGNLLLNNYYSLTYHKNQTRFKHQHHVSNNFVEWFALQMHQTIQYSSLDDSK